MKKLIVSLAIVALLTAGCGPCLDEEEVNDVKTSGAMEIYGHYDIAEFTGENSKFTYYKWHGLYYSISKTGGCSRRSDPNCFISTIK